MSEDALDILKVRLARGEICSSEYERLRSLISQKSRTPVENRLHNTIVSNELSSFSSHSMEQEVVAQHENNILYNDKIVSSNGGTYLIDQIQSIQVTNFRKTINFIPIYTYTGFTCFFNDLKRFDLIETKTFFARASHDSIKNFYLKLLELSFKFRLQFFIDKLKSKKRILIKGQPSSCSVTLDGRIEQGSKKVFLKQARKNGFLCIGSKEVSGITGITYSSHRFDPNQIIVSQHAAPSGKIPKDSIRCSPDQNCDVIISFINWFSQEGNILE